LATPNRSQAAFDVRVYDDGVLQVGIGVISGSNGLIFQGTTTHFSLTNGSAVSNFPGTQTFSSLSVSSNQQISTTFGAAGGTHTIRIEISENGWQAPVGSPLFLSSSAGGSYASSLQGNSLTATYQGFLDNTNTMFGQPAAGSTPLQTASASPVGTPLTSALVFTPDPSINPVVPGGTPFSMTSVLTFTFNIQAGSGQDQANVSASTVTVVPAPPGLALALIGVPLLGVSAWIRRRRQLGETSMAV
jgi:hypothetical protein